MMTREELAFQQGAVDTYYGRTWNPKIKLDDRSGIVIPKEEMSKAEIIAYTKAYDTQPFGTKDHGDDEPEQ